MIKSREEMLFDLLIVIPLYPYAFQVDLLFACTIYCAHSLCVYHSLLTLSCAFYSLHHRLARAFAQGIFAHTIVCRTSYSLRELFLRAADCVRYLLNPVTTSLSFAQHYRLKAYILFLLVILFLRIIL